jgi:transposase
MKLTDVQWELIRPHLPKLPRRPDGKGRPWRDSREVLEGILWILKTGASWKDLPPRYPPYQTCHRRFQQWVRSNVMRKILETLAEDLKARGGLDLSECFIDGTFVPAKKGALVSGKLNVERAQNSWQLQTAMVFLSPYPLKVLKSMKSRLSKM